MAIRGAKEGPAAGFACRFLWMTKNIIRSLNALSYVRSVALYADTALGVAGALIRATSSFLKVAGQAGKGEMAKGLLKIGWGLGLWQAADPGGPVETFSAIVPGPPGTLPQSYSGGIAWALRHTILEDEDIEEYWKYAVDLADEAFENDEDDEEITDILNEK